MLALEDCNKRYSEHFINFILKGKKFDFDDFKSQEELEEYQKEVEEYLNENNK